MGAEHMVKLEIELGGTGEPIRGELEDDSGASKTFSGWIGLVAAIEAARNAAHGSPTTKECRDEAHDG